MSLTDTLEQWASVYVEHTGKQLARTPITQREVNRAESFWGLPFTSEMVELYSFSNGLFGNAQHYFVPDSVWFPSAKYATSHHGDLDFDELIDLDLKFFNSNPGATSRSIPIMFGSYTLGVVCSGPGTGAVWFFGGEDLTWISRSLEEMFRHTLEWQERGWIDWSRSAPRLNQHAHGGPVPTESYDPPWTNHWGDWRWESVK